MRVSSVVSTTQAYGIHNVAKNIVPANATWVSLLAGFLAAQ